MAAAEILGLTAGYKFQPDDDEVIEFFLLPRLRGQPLPLNGIFIDDDPLSAPPWKLLSRNGRGEEDDAFFFAPGDAAKSRKGRNCAAVGTWIGQKYEKTGELLRVGDEIFEWQKYRLNFHFHYGSGRSGSMGYVMMEYSVVVPDDCASFKVCHISFTGHGQKRKRVPDDYQNDSAVTRHQLQAAATSSSTATCYQDPNPNGAHAYQQDQEHFLMQPQDAGVNGVTTTWPWIYPHQEHFSMQPQVHNDAGLDGVTTVPWIYQHQEPFAMTTQQQFVGQELVDLGRFDLLAMDQGMMPLHMDQETCVPEHLADYGTMQPPIDQDYDMPEQYVEYGYGTMTLPMEQESGVLPEQFFDDPMLRQLPESIGDSATAAQADARFGDHWASAGQDYDRHHRHVFPEQSLGQHQVL